MDDSRIVELLEPFLSDGPVSTRALSPAQLRSISTYIDILSHWNVRINLTAVRQPEEIVTRHFGESLFAARHLFVQPDGGTVAIQPHVVDIGSGAGFPGLPIKIWAPHVNLTLIESNHKKVTFLREVVRSLGLTGVDVFAGRADAFAGSQADVVTIRAVERLESILPVAAGLVREGGRLALLIGTAQVSGVCELLDGLKWDKDVNSPKSDNRVLLLGRKHHDG